MPPPMIAPDPAESRAVAPAPPARPVTAGGRRRDLDGLRILGCYLLFVFHAGKVFDDVAPDYHVRNAEILPTVGLVTWFIHQWHMPLFFLLAGWAAVVSLGHRGVRGFLRERFARLLVPLIAGMVLLCPIIKYVELSGGIDMRPSGLRAAPPLDLTFIEFLPRFFGRLDHATWSHLWFLAYLLVFCVAFLPVLHRLRAPAGRTRTTGRRAIAWLVLAVLPLIAVQVALRERWPGYMNLYDDWAAVSYYGLFFLFGAALAARPGLDAAIAAVWPWFGAAGVAAYAGMLAQPGPAASWALSAVVGWGVTIGLIGLAARIDWARLPGIAWLHDSAMPVFLLNNFVIVVLAGWIVHWPVGPGAKLAALFLIAVPATLALYQFGIRHSAPARLLCGLKSPARRRAGPVPA